MPPHPATTAPLKALAILGLTLLAARGAAVAGTAPPRAAAPAAVAPPAAVPDDGAALADARDRSARAEAAVDGLRRAMSPGHVTDPMPGADRPFGLEILRADYADLQRRAAGYRATLGDHHPTLVAAEQALAELRGQLLDGTRRALASAERDAAAARAEVEAIARRDAARSPAAAGDATGSIAAEPRPAPRPRAEAPARPIDPMALPAPAGEPVPTAPGRRASHLPPLDRLSPRLLGAAAAASAVLVAAGALLGLFRPGRRARRPAARRIEPGLARVDEAAAAPGAETVPPPAAPRPSPNEGVPVLGALPLPSDPGRAHPVPSHAADEVHATLRAAFGPDGRMTVLVSPAEGLPPADADGAALALALAAAAAGRRALLLEARSGGRLRRSLVGDGAAPALAEVAGTVRTLYRLEAVGLTVALLPSDAGEAEAARDAERRPATARIGGLSAFDTVLVLCDAAGAGALAAGADLALVVAPAGATASDLAAAAAPLRAADRPCGALLVERAPVAASKAAAPRGAPAARRRLPPADAVPAGRLGLRGSIDPVRRRRGA